MGKVVLQFEGVKVSGDFMTGVLSSDELIAQFNESWIPAYQRDRLMSKRKIESLKEVFTTGGKIDSVKLNLIGEYYKDGRQAVVEGSLRVIDGQQRLWALKESGAKGVKVPVELYLNISENEEIELFHQFNRDQSKLTTGDLAKSTTGTFGRTALTRALKDKSLPISVGVNSRANGLNLQIYSTLLCLVHRKIFLKTLMMKAPHGKGLLNFLEDEFSENQVNMCVFATRNILTTFVLLFGSYDRRASVYSRKFMLAFSNVIISNFMADTGQISFKTFKGKAKDLPRLVQNARTRELISNGSEAMVYNHIVDFFNFKCKTNRLERIESRLAVDPSKEFSEFSKKKERATKLVNSAKAISSGSHSAGIAMSAKGR